ncbi:hypothetical protein Nepgr_020638 [Nepenthes gracilis]|uniref:U1 small nuclear ribonucleoprotein C n=1 Tax=Nepenthes gracilis TaxID=150966 RepID=A0AAD3SYD4_NEPGR|nr:hypothetical protein Nepgr_020638 [Nepenthes gracilis]
MPRYYCDYCDTYLTHDSPSVRKQHNAGYKHKANVRSYYQQFEEQQTQSLIDQRIKEHLGQAAAFQQVGAAYAAWQRARPPVLPTPPILPIPGSVPSGAALVPGVRPPVLPRPIPGAPVYGTAPVLAPMPSPAGHPGAPMQANGPPGPPSMNAPTSVTGVTMTAGSNGTPATGGQPMYQAIPSSGSFGAPIVPAASSFQNTSISTAHPPPTNADSFGYAQAPHNAH